MPPKSAIVLLLLSDKHVLCRGYRYHRPARVRCQCHCQGVDQYLLATGALEHYDCDIVRLAIEREGKADHVSGIWLRIDTELH